MNNAFLLAGFALACYGIHLLAGLGWMCVVAGIVLFVFGAWNTALDARDGRQ